jgi:hypothetical protein
VIATAARRDFIGVFMFSGVDLLVDKTRFHALSFKKTVRTFRGGFKQKTTKPMTNTYSRVPEFQIKKPLRSG